MDASLATELEIITDPRLTIWADAAELWLSTRRAENTRQAYRKALKDFLSFANTQPWDIGKGHIIAWIDALRKQRLSEATIALRVAAVSSFYMFVSEDYSITSPDGKQIPLFPFNPAAGRTYRPKPQKYRGARFLTADEAKTLLRVIRTDSDEHPDYPHLKRNYALFLIYLATGRRNSEIRNLRWGDIDQVGEQIFYRWSGKGKEDQRYELPSAVYKAIVAWMKDSGRWPANDGDYIFIAQNKQAARLPNVKLSYDPSNQPISMYHVERLFRRYAKLAGLETKGLKVHSLRHTAAMLRREAGDDVGKICEFLGHSSVAITQIYLHTIEGQKDTSWGTVSQLLGLS